MIGNKNNRFTKYIVEIKKELFERSLWPTRQEVFNQTIIVIFVLMLASVFLGLADYFVTYLTRALLDGSFVYSVFGSTVGLVLSIVVAILIISYFVIKNFRKNRYNR